MRVQSVGGNPPQRYAPSSPTGKTPGSCPPEVRDRVTLLLRRADSARQKRNLDLGLSMVGMLGAVAAGVAGQGGLAGGMVLLSMASGAMGIREGVKAASLTLEAIDLASEYGCPLKHYEMGGN